MGVSKNIGTPKLSILIGFSIINHPFWGTPIFGNTQIYKAVMIFSTYNQPSLSRNLHVLYGNLGGIIASKVINAYPP